MFAFDERDIQVKIQRGRNKEEKTRLTYMEKGDLEEFWTHLAGRVSCTTEPSSDWSNPHSHPGNDDRLVRNSSRFITWHMLRKICILFVLVIHRSRKTSARSKWLEWTLFYLFIFTVYLIFYQKAAKTTGSSKFHWTFQQNINSNNFMC